MARVLTSRSRRPVRRLGGVNVLHGNAVAMGGFKHFRAGHELAIPSTLPDGQKVYRTPTGKTFTIKRMSS